MNLNLNCPDCTCQLSEKANRCSCGWIKPAVTNTKSDYRCWYQFKEERCPLPGTISPYSNKWFCSEHFQTLNDYKKAETVFHNIKAKHKNFF